ncbi:response regulator transcription factor [Erythrobacter sp. LQ02-29]|uniref:response regulator transcription factor n=1 Tax=Erythrobacter sp. LQ02-29 TaxID=2920384 RepID=UPI001F4D760C|nr:response regulator transcription factor [Erythrobacter sp. LQ02-29]MCP9221239.1 response regulator transcription factor [Erythrobacter sp. LQ02-29]
MLKFAVVDHDMRRKADVVMQFSDIGHSCAPYDNVEEFADSGRHYDLLLLAERADGAFRDDLESLRSTVHGQKTIVYSTDPHYANACEALRLGALDLRAWPFDLTEIEAWWHRNAETFLPVNRLRLRTREARDRLAALTSRERDILHAIADGKSNKMIAAGLGVSHRTIEAHRLRLLKKIEVTNSSDAVRISIESRLFDPA